MNMLTHASYAFDIFFFFSSRRRHTRSLCDWSSDVCSSDLPPQRSHGLRNDRFTDRNDSVGYLHFTVRSFSILGKTSATLAPFARDLGNTNLPRAQDAEERKGSNV